MDADQLVENKEARLDQLTGKATKVKDGGTRETYKKKV